MTRAAGHEPTDFFSAFTEQGDDMKVYGFDSTDIVRGELQAARVDAAEMYFPDEVQGRLDWEFLSTRFPEARAALVKHMKEQDSDPEAIEVVQSLKASFVPVQD